MERDIGKKDEEEVRCWGDLTEGDLTEGDSDKRSGKRNGKKLAD
jgi:hypothetical protein